MPAIIVIFLLQMSLLFHAWRTGRLNPWGFIIIAIPVAGAVAYLLFEIVPEWFGSRHGQKAQRAVINTFSPERRYRELGSQLEVSDTVATRSALADECLTLGKFEEAKLHFDEILDRHMGDEPLFMLGRARAEFGLREPEKAVATLDELRRKWPDFQSADGHLLYARALHEANRHDEALEEFAAVSNYYSGAEARVRWGQVLDALGRRQEARAVFRDVLLRYKNAPFHAKEMQAEWLAIAERELRK